MSLPDAAAVATAVSRFEAELAQAKSPRDAQAVRNRFLARKNGVVASWMQTIGAAPPEQKREIGRLVGQSGIEPLEKVRRNELRDRLAGDQGSGDTNDLKGTGRGSVTQARGGEGEAKD